jgi:hypothetical protein
MEGCDILPVLNQDEGENHFHCCCAITLLRRFADRRCK